MHWVRVAPGSGSEARASRSRRRAELAADLKAGQLSSPDDSRHLLGAERAKGVAANVASRADPQQGGDPGLVVREVRDADNVIFAHGPQQFADPAARALDEF